MLPASFVQMERFWHNIATYVINLCIVCVTVLFSLNEFILVKLALTDWDKFNKWKQHTINTQVDHIGCNIVPKFFCLHEASR